MYDERPICVEHNLKMTLSSNENYWYCEVCEEIETNELLKKIDIRNAIKNELKRIRNDVKNNI